MGTADTKAGYRGQVPHDKKNFGGGLWRPASDAPADRRAAWRQAELDHHM